MKKKKDLKTRYGQSFAGVLPWGGVVSAVGVVLAWFMSRGVGVVATPNLLPETAYRVVPFHKCQTVNESGSVC